MPTKSKSTRKKSVKLTKVQLKAQVQMYAVVLFSLGLFFLILSMVKGSSGWLMLHNVLMGVMGWGGFLIGPMMIYIAVLAAFDKINFNITARLSMIFLWILVFSSVVTVYTPNVMGEGGIFNTFTSLYDNGVNIRGGGVISIVFAYCFTLLGDIGSKIISVIALFAMSMVVSGTSLSKLINTAGKPVVKISEGYQDSVVRMGQKTSSEDLEFPTIIRPKLPSFSSFDDEPKPRQPKKNITPNSSHSKERLFAAAGVEIPQKQQKPPSDPPPELEPKLSKKPKIKTDEQQNEKQEQEIDDILQRLANENTTQTKPEKTKSNQTTLKEKIPPPIIEQTAVKPVINYKMPPIELLKEPSLNVQEQPIEELKQNAQRLVDTLMSFGVSTRIIDICRGPAVTRYELQPAAGVKISKITNLADDIALNLAASGVRIEAPIPNKPAVGIEIPNKNISPVSLREVVDSVEFEQSKSNVTVALGRDIAGNITIANIAKMPHVLIAGSTGSGKSVCINSLIMSILYKSTPEQVRLLMVDPKVVELGIYNGLPHLLVPVVTDPKKAAGALSWAVTEMLNRYKLFAQYNVRDINGYNRVCEDDLNITKMPHIVIIIDELSDLMMAAPNEVEDYICRLAQMARAAGMHLVIATQRPSVDVITGIIKANIPSRIAFAVSSQIDSRTILDMSGAEKLLGMGDMLFYPVGAAKPIRVQGCFVSDSEIENVVNFIKGSGETQYDETIMEEIEKQAVVTKNNKENNTNTGGGFSNDEDEMIPDAISCVVEAGMASTSLLQRKLKLGYARAARIIDQLEAKGIVGTFEGSKPRQVLISKDRWMEMKLNM